MMQLLYANAETMKIPQVGGHHGHIDLIVKPTLYTTLSTKAWINPTSHGVQPTLSMKATADH